ncbi:integrase [Bacillus cereus]|uniref:tyrosine-type recombinase/integrase n=1 Tax=Bacillus cereus TaxID=1396 RepID=UPI000BF929D3|nr:tyrosine-type recombinase/integrase [Bacillus cereus]PFK30762.1 integrase [Bacillus cereus]
MALVTGIRQGELLGLRWKDVDLEKGHLTISQTLNRDGKTFLLGGKTQSSLRKILLPVSRVAKLDQKKYAEFVSYFENKIFDDIIRKQPLSKE